MAIEIGVFLPMFTPDPARSALGDIQRSARFAEELGVGSVWATDQLVTGAPILDSTIVLATAAAVTTRLTIGFNVLLPALRPVAWTAKQLTTLQYVSGNRLVLGVGTGNPAYGEVGWRAAGVSFADRGRRTDDALRVLPGLVTGQAVELDGVEVTLAPGAAMPPVVVGGNGRAALRRAARFGDGWASIGLPPDQIADGLAEIRGLGGREEIRATAVAPQLDSDPHRAATRLAEYEASGVERAILAPGGGDWQRDYEFAASVGEALSR